MVASAVDLMPTAERASKVMATHVELHGFCAGCLTEHSIATWFPCTVYQWAERVAHGGEVTAPERLGWADEPTEEYRFVERIFDDTRPDFAPPEWVRLETDLFPVIIAGLRDY